MYCSKLVHIYGSSFCLAQFNVLKFDWKESFPLENTETNEAFVFTLPSGLTRFVDLIDQ